MWLKLIVRYHLLKDPIPFLTIGADDITVAVNSRECDYFTKPLLHASNVAEPSTAVMHLRSTEPLKEVLLQWILLVIQSNQVIT